MVHYWVVSTLDGEVERHDFGRDLGSSMICPCRVWWQHCNPSHSGFSSTNLEHPQSRNTVLPWNGIAIWALFLLDPLRDRCRSTYRSFLIHIATPQQVCFQRSVPFRLFGLKETTHHFQIFQTQRSKPNNNCCWEASKRWTSGWTWCYPLVN